MYTLKDSRVFNLGTIAQPESTVVKNKLSGTVASCVGVYRFEIFEVKVLILMSRGTTIVTAYQNSKFRAFNLSYFKVEHLSPFSYFWLFYICRRRALE